MESDRGRPNLVDGARSDRRRPDPVEGDDGRAGTALSISLSLPLFISLTLSSPPLLIRGRRDSGVGRSGGRRMGAWRAAGGVHGGSHQWRL
jgi:hypothetical protein